MATKTRKFSAATAFSQTSAKTRLNLGDTPPPKDYDLPERFRPEKLPPRKTGVSLAPKHCKPDVLKAKEAQQDKPTNLKVVKSTASVSRIAVVVKQTAKSAARNAAITGVKPAAKGIPTRIGKGRKLPAKPKSPVKPPSPEKIKTPEKPKTPEKLPTPRKETPPPEPEVLQIFVPAVDYIQAAKAKRIELIVDYQDNQFAGKEVDEHEINEIGFDSMTIFDTEMDVNAVPSFRLLDDSDINPAALDNRGQDPMEMSIVEDAVVCGKPGHHVSPERPPFQSPRKSAEKSPTPTAQKAPVAIVGDELLRIAFGAMPVALDMVLPKPIQMPRSVSPKQQSPIRAPQTVKAPKLKPPRERKPKEKPPPPKVPENLIGFESPPPLPPIECVKKSPTNQPMIIQVGSPGEFKQKLTFAELKEKQRLKREEIRQRKIDAEKAKRLENQIKQTVFKGPMTQQECQLLKDIDPWDKNIQPRKLFNAPPEYEQPPLAPPVYDLDPPKPKAREPPVRRRPNMRGAPFGGKPPTMDIVCDDGGDGAVPNVVMSRSRREATPEKIPSPRYKTPSPQRMATPEKTPSPEQVLTPKTPTPEHRKWKETKLLDKLGLTYEMPTYLIARRMFNLKRRKAMLAGQIPYHHGFIEMMKKEDERILAAKNKRLGIVEEPPPPPEVVEEKPPTPKKKSPPKKVIKKPLTEKQLQQKFEALALIEEHLLTKEEKKFLIERHVETLLKLQETQAKPGFLENAFAKAAAKKVIVRK